jgi:hypothetical protein
MFAVGNVTIQPVDGVDAPLSGPGLLMPVILYNFSVPHSGDQCFRLAGSTTDMQTVLNFSGVNYIVEVQLMGSVSSVCTQNPPWTGWRTASIINFTSLNFSDPGIGPILAGLGDAIRPTIVPPNEFGVSRIWVNTTFFEKLNSPARITLDWLPYTFAPNITADNSSRTISNVVWSLNPYDAELDSIDGNLSFTVSGFSGYNTTDNINPTVAFAITNGSTTTVSSINVSVNGTGTQPGRIIFYVDNVAVALYNESDDTNNANCFNVTAGSDYFNCKFTYAFGAGVRNITVVAFDYGGVSLTGPGNTVTSEINFTATADATPPTMGVITPVNNSFTTDRTPLIQFNVSDDLSVNVSSAVVNVSGVLYNSTATGLIVCTPTNESFMVCSFSPLSLYNLTDGTHPINISAADDYNNKVSALRYVIVDGSPAIVAEYGPSGSVSAASGASLTVWINASDVVGNISSVTLYNGTNVLVQNTTYIEGTNFSTTWTVPTLPTGTTVPLRWQVIDNSGNANYTPTATLTIPDTTAPVVKLMQPVSGQLFTTKSFNIQFNITDDFNISNNSIWIDLASMVESQYYRSLGNITCTGSNIFQVCNVTGFHDYDDNVGVPISIYVNDSTNNQNITAFTVRIDYYSPFWNNYSVNATSVTTGGTVTFRINASDDGSNVSNIQLIKDGTTVIATNSSYTSGTVWSYIYTDNDAVGLTSTFNYNFTDGSGHVNQTGTMSVTAIDTTSPAIILVAPANNTNLSSGTVTVQLNVTDNNAVNASTVNVTVSGTSYYGNTSVCSGTSNMFCTFVIGVADGLKTLVLNAKDNSDNPATPSATLFTVDTVAPVISDYGRLGTFFAQTGSTVTFWVNATDATSAISHVDFMVDGTTNLTNTSYAKGTNFSISFVVPTAWTVGSEHTIYWNVFDAVNLNTGSGTMIINVSDGTSPTVSLVSPTNNSNVSTSPQTIQVNVNDNYQVNQTGVIFNVSGTLYNSTGAGLVDCSGGTAASRVCTLTQALGDGAKTLIVSATDVFGNAVTSGTYLFTVDTAAPYYTQYGPTSVTAAVGSTLYFYSNWTDTTTQVAAVNFVANGSLYLSNTSYTKGRLWNTTYIVPNAVGQTLLLSFNATDSVGLANSTPTMSLTIIDLTAPNVTWVSPVNRTYVSAGATTFVFTITDNYNVSVGDSMLSIEGSDFVLNSSVCTAGMTSSTCTLTTTLGVGAGDFDVFVNASDSAGNRYVSGTQVYPQDTTEPTIVLNTLNNKWFTSTSPVLQYTAIDNINTTFVCNLTIVGGATSQTGIATVNNTLTNRTIAGAVNSGNYTYNVTCVDAVGNRNTSATQRFMVDTTAPTTTITLSGATANGAGWYRTPVTVTVNGTDASLAGVQTVGWSNSSGTGYTYVAATGAGFAIASNFSGNTIWAKSNDTAGNTGVETSQEVKYDSVVPSVTAVVPSSPLVPQSASIVLDVYTTDAVSGLSTANYTFGANTGALSLGSGKFSGTLTAPAIDGLVTIYVTIFDAAGNGVTNTTVINVNSSLPSITVDKASGSYIASGATVTVGWSNITNGWYSLDQAATVGVTSANASQVITISGVEGVHNLSIWANNSVTTTNQNYTYVIDSTAPTLTITNPLNNTIVNGSLSMTATAADTPGSGMASVEFKLGSTSLVVDTTSPYSTTITTTAYTDGAYVLTAIATDNLGLTTTKAFNVNISNTGAGATTVATSGDAASSSAQLTVGSLTGTPVETTVYSINGLNTTTVTMQLMSTSSVSPSSTQLSSVIGVINITAGTGSSSTIYLLMPKSTLTGLGLSAPYSTIAFYANHNDGNGIVGPLTSSYVDEVTLNTVVYARFSVSTTHYSIFMWGIQGTTTTPPSGGSGSGGRTTTTVTNTTVVAPWETVTGTINQPLAPVPTTKPAVKPDTETTPSTEPVTQPEQKPAETAPPAPQKAVAKAMSTGMIVLIVVVVLALGSIGYFWYKKKY